MVWIKLSKQEINERIIKNNPLILQLDDYIDCDTKINWKCLVCNNIWMATPYKIINGHTGCNKCAGNLKLTDLDIDDKLLKLNKNIIRIGKSNGSNSKIEWKCTECDYIWNAEVSSILHGKRTSGCLRCSGLIKLTNYDLDIRLLILDKKIKRVGNVNGIHRNIKWLCEICNEQFTAQPSNILNKNRKRGCSNCVKSFGEKLVKEILIENNIKFKSQYNIYIENIKRPKRIDYYLEDKNFFIEYNGIQHYEPTRFYTHISKEQAELNLKNQQVRDNIIKNYCILNKINLLEIDSRLFIKLNENDTKSKLTNIILGNII